MRDRRNPGLELYRGGNIRPSFEGVRNSLPAEAGAAAQAPDAWRNLGLAAAHAGLVINKVLGEEYRTREIGRADEAALEAARKFELWKGDYMAQMRGKLGMNAVQDFQESYAKICEEAEKDFGGSENEIFRDLLRRKLAERGLTALKEGNSFQREQTRAWQESVAAAQWEDFAAFAASNPDDAAGIAIQAQNLMASLKAKDPGLETGAMRAKLNALEFKSRMDGFIARGDAAGARAYLARFGDIRKLTPYGTNKSWCLAHNNPGAVTVGKGEAWGAYASLHDGYKAIMDRIQSYHRDRNKRTPAQIMAVYAPPSENNTRAYIEFVRKQTGLDPEKEIDPKDPATLVAMTRAILGYEFSQKASEAELLAAANDLLKNGPPKPIGSIERRKGMPKSFLPGMDPAAFALYEKRVQALEEGEAAAADQERADAILERVRLLPIERRDAEILKILENMPREERERMRPLLKAGVESRKKLDFMSRSFALRDAFASRLKKTPDAPDDVLEVLYRSMAAGEENPEIRQGFLSFAAEELKNRRELRAAKDAVSVRQFMEGQKNKSPAEIQAAIAASSLSPEAKARAAQLSWGLAKEENPANIKMAALALALKDLGSLDSEAELEAFAAQNNLTQGQVNRVRDYRGASAQVSIGRVNSILKALTAAGEFDGPEQIDARGYHALLSQLKPGHEPSDQELTSLIANLYASDGSFFFKKTVMDELMEDQFKMDWLPEVKSWQRPELEALLEARGLKKSERNLRLLLKLNIFNQMGWAIKDNPQWEKD